MHNSQHRPLCRQEFLQGGRSSAIPATTLGWVDSLRLCTAIEFLTPTAALRVLVLLVVPANSLWRRGDGNGAFNCAYFSGVNEARSDDLNIYIYISTRTISLCQLFHEDVLLFGVRSMLWKEFYVGFRLLLVCLRVLCLVCSFSGKREWGSLHVLSTAEACIAFPHGRRYWRARITSAFGTSSIQCSML